MPRILVKKNDIQVDQYIVETGNIRIGRTPDNDIVLNDPSVSRSHCELKIDGSKITVIDLNSSNGTYVNGIKISRIISSRAMIGIGVFQLEVGGPEPVGRPAPPASTEDVEATMMFAPGGGGSPSSNAGGTGNRHREEARPNQPLRPNQPGSHQPTTMMPPVEDDEPKKGNWLSRLFGGKK